MTDPPHPLAPATHPRIDPELVGVPTELRPGFASVTLVATERMAADAHGLVHGGFVFGLADYAAMLAVNDVNVVLGSADVRFLLPCQVGETLIAQAQVASEAGKKRTVNVAVYREEAVVLSGTFQCFVLPSHVLTTTAEKRAKEKA